MLSLYEAISIAKNDHLIKTKERTTNYVGKIYLLIDQYAAGILGLQKYIYKKR